MGKITSAVRGFRLIKKHSKKIVLGVVGYLALAPLLLLGVVVAAFTNLATGLWTFLITWLVVVALSAAALYRK